jgi:hypothetical protein
MSMSSKVKPPAVVWSDDTPPEVDEALVFPPRVQQLVNQLWHRLPEEARAIIACHLRHVTLVPHESEGISCGHGAEEILVYLPDEAIHIEPEFESWKPGIAWVVVWGFGQAFLWSLLTRIVGVNPEESSFSDASQDLPGAAWLMTMAAGRFGEPAMRHLLDRMSEGLALAWGFGEELAALMDRDAIREPHAYPSGGLDAEMGKVLRALRLRAI